MAEKKDTTAYSATKAAETREHAEEKKTVRDWRLQPGGETGSPTLQGMAALDHGDPRQSDQSPVPISKD